MSEVGAHTLEYVSLRARLFHLNTFVQQSPRLKVANILVQCITGAAHAGSNIRAATIVFAAL